MGEEERGEVEGSVGHGEEGVCGSLEARRSQQAVSSDESAVNLLEAMIKSTWRLPLHHSHLLLSLHLIPQLPYLCHSTAPQHHHSHPFPSSPPPPHFAAPPAAPSLPVHHHSPTHRSPHHYTPTKHGSLLQGVRHPRLWRNRLHRSTRRPLPQHPGWLQLCRRRKEQGQARTQDEGG